MIAKLFRHPVPRIIDAVLRVEIAVKTVDSIKSHLASAKLPAVKELADFDFVASPVNEPLIHDLAGGGFLEAERSIVLVERTGTGKIISPLPSRETRPTRRARHCKRPKRTNSPCSGRCVIGKRRRIA